MATTAPSHATASPAHEQDLGSGPLDDAQILLAPYCTLDEPVSETIMRDVRAVGGKLRVVMLPLDRNIGGLGRYANVTTSSDGEPGTQGDDEPGKHQQEIMNKLRDWDLWGPLVVCLTLSILLSTKAPNSSEASAVFAAVFVAVWVGSSIVTINAQLLGGTISFFQSVCVLGYCIFPLDVAAFLITVLRHTPLGIVWLNIVWVLVGFVWATRASTVFIGQYIAPERRALAVFPVFFFYTFLGWMILLL